MAVGLQEGTVRGVYRIVIWDNDTLDSEADAETERTLTDRERLILAHADSLALKITLGAETGTASLQVDSLGYSRDGSVWGTWDDISDVALTAAGEYRLDMTKSLLHATHIRCNCTVTLSGSQYFAASTIAIEAAVKNVYGLI